MKFRNFFWGIKYQGPAFLLLFCIATLAPKQFWGQIHPYQFKHLTVDDGLSHTDANDIVQDEKGYIWIATYFGLNRFDGYKLKRFYNSNKPLDNAFKNRIRCVCPDETGNLWLGTEGGLQRFDPRLENYMDFDEIGTHKQTFEKLCKPAGGPLYAIVNGQLKIYTINGDSIKNKKINIPEDFRFLDIANAQNGILYLINEKGLWLLDKREKLMPVPIKGITGQHLFKMYFDKQENLLLVTSNTVIHLSKKNLHAKAGTEINQDSLKRFEVKAGGIRDVIADNKTGYWVGTNTALFRLDNNMHLIQAISNKSSVHGLNGHTIANIYIDRSECLWVCTFGGGVNYCDLNEKLFYTLRHDPEILNSLSGDHIRSVLEDGKNLWIGTNVNGLNLYNLETQTFSFYNTYNTSVRLKSDQVPALALDDNHYLWIGTGSGIEILKPGGKELWTPPGYDKFPAHVIDVLAKDCFGNIWFGNHSDPFGVIWKDEENVYHVKYYSEGYFILPDTKKPQLFVSSTQGLKRLIIDATGNIIRSFDYTASLKGNALSSNYTYPVRKQNDSMYWVGTIGGGLNQILLQKNNLYKINSYTGKQGIFNDVESLELDNAGNIWLGGNGLEAFNPETRELKRYDRNDGLQGNSFKVGASYKGTDGRMYFGGINGLNYFYPDEIKINMIAAQPVLTDILINNQRPQYANADSSTNAIAEAIGYGKEIQLDYLHNNIVISFSSMHFANPLKCRYRYKLEGFDEDWQSTDGNNPSAAYNNLDYATYQFIVEATNNDGIGSKKQASVTITITPPWWKSGIAKTIYILLILSVLLGIYIYQARWYRLKRELEVRAVNEKKKEEIHNQRLELYQQQLMFFTNISHEFRTPLTLILGPLEGLMNENKNKGWENTLQLMFRNAKRLINLVSELMNFRKVADNVINLQVHPLDINRFFENLASEFEVLAAAKKISFRVTNQIISDSDKPITGLLDIQVLEKILFNLLNNAFKYTKAGGQVAFELFFDIAAHQPGFDNEFKLLNTNFRAKKYIYFSISDSGIGISADSITRIFDRYYRVSNDQIGSGIGLALVKSLTQLHKGDIYVYSEKQRGTEIIIGIPWGGESYTDAEQAAGTNNGPETQLEMTDNSTLLPMPGLESDNHLSVPKNKKTVLLAEDNHELRNFLKQALVTAYHVLDADDGKSALELAIDKIPDLIISDVMMPGMDGLTLCKLIKERFETSHIPFIILSAKDALATKIEGMESGADYYFAKPLSIDLLLLTIRNIFEQREKLKTRYTNNHLVEATELVHSEKDKFFLQQVLELIENNIQQPDLDVDFLCQHLYISRTKLYQKIKSISDQSVAEFIRTIRLKKAIFIMTHEDISMNDVAEKIGLQSNSNFSRAFKKEYGMSPMQFIQSLKKEN